MKKRLSIPIEADLHTALKLAAARQQISMVEFVKSAVLVAITETVNNLPSENTRHEQQRPQ